MSRIKRHLGRRQSEMDEAIHAAHFFGRHPKRGVEIFHFTRKTCRQNRCIKRLDRRNATATIDQVIPSRCNRIADWRNDAQTRDDDATLVHDASV
jgi:hypothetical protein